MVTIDGASVLAKSISPPTNIGQVLRLGVQEFIGTDAVLRFDDLACDVTP